MESQKDLVEQIPEDLGNLLLSGPAWPHRNCKMARLLRGISILQLEERSGVSHQTILTLEKTGRGSLETKYRISLALGVSVHELFPESDDFIRIQKDIQERMKKICKEIKEKTAEKAGQIQAFKK